MARGKAAKGGTTGGAEISVPGAVSIEVSIESQRDAALEWLRQHRTQKDLDNLQRFGISASNPIGVSVANIQKLAKELGRSHALAAALWETGVYEGRMLAVFVDEPELVTARQMEQWCRDFDNWGICDTVCFHLFDRTRDRWAKVPQWCARPEEFVRRSGFALLASLAGHDRTAGEEQFLACLPLIEAAANDERNFVKKAVSWALRRVGTRSAALHSAAWELASRLAGDADATARWIGKDALRDLSRRKPAARGKKVVAKKAARKQVAASSPTSARKNSRPK